MNKVFLDTNLIVYANDTRDAQKQARAIELITTAMREGTGVISIQVMQEYAVVAGGKLRQDPDTILRQLLLLVGQRHFGSFVVGLTGVRNIRGSLFGNAGFDYQKCIQWLPNHAHRWGSYRC